MRIRVANGAALTGLSLLALGGGAGTFLDLAGAYQWAARFLIVLGVWFCGVHQTRKGHLREQGPDLPSGSVSEGQLIDVKKGCHR